VVLQPLTVLDIGARARRSCVGAHFKVVPHFVVRRYDTKIFVLVTAKLKKRHPYLRLSDWWRLTFDDIAVFLVHSLTKVFLFCLPGPLLLLGPHGLFTFYRCFLTDVTGVESGLVRYSFLNYFFHRAHLLCPMFS
jgi:hypothetical protein